MTSNIHNISLKTGYAQRTINGSTITTKKKYVKKIPGFTYFSYKLNTIWNDASHKNPFAFWFLYKVEQRILESELMLEKELVYIEELSSNKLDTEEIYEAQEFSLNIVHASAFKLIRLIITFDNCVAEYNTLNKQGLISDEERRVRISSMNGSLLNVMYIMQDYQSHKVSTVDLQNNSKLAVIASTAMGMIPPKILNFELVAEHTPNNVKSYIDTQINKSAA